MHMATVQTQEGGFEKDAEGSPHSSGFTQRSPAVCVRDFWGRGVGEPGGALMVFLNYQ